MYSWNGKGQGDFQFLKFINIYIILRLMHKSATSSFPEIFPIVAKNHVTGVGCVPMKFWCFMCSCLKTIPQSNAFRKIG
jgi:hypothetical protein